MSLFSKLTGSDKKSGDDKPKPERQSERIEGKGERVAILPQNKTYEILDFSLGGFCLTGYDGTLKGNQYFEFKFLGNKNGDVVEAEGFANVVRAKDDLLACKFPPQPRLKRFMADYLN